MRTPASRSRIFVRAAVVVRVDPDRHARAHGQLVAGHRHHRLHLRVLVVEVDLQGVRIEREEPGREVVEEAGAQRGGIDRRSLPDEIHELFHMCGKLARGHRVAVAAGRCSTTRYGATSSRTSDDIGTSPRVAYASARSAMWSGS